MAVLTLALDDNQHSLELGDPLALSANCDAESPISHLVLAGLPTNARKEILIRGLRVQDRPVSLSRLSPLQNTQPPTRSRDWYRARGLVRVVRVRA
jgi:hypothetical protein